MISKEKKAEIIATYGRKPGDTGSPEVQVAILTERTRRITTQEEVFLRWLVREELYLHILRIQILNLTEISLSV